MNKCTSPKSRFFTSFERFFQPFLAVFGVVVDFAVVVSFLVESTLTLALEDTLAALSEVPRLAETARAVLNVYTNKISHQKKKNNEDSKTLPVLFDT